MKKENFKHNHKNRRHAGDTGTKTCFVTKDVMPRSNMLRFVSAPGRVIMFDVAEKLPGHGFWLTANRALLRQAVTKRLFYKAAKGTVVIPDDLEDKVIVTLKARCLSLMSLCRKAGLLVFGFEAVKKAVEQQQVVAAFEASNASEREHNKIFRPEDPFPVYTFFTREELGQIIGGADIVHIALLNGKLSTQAVAAAHKLTLFLKDSEQKG